MSKENTINIQIYMDQIFNTLKDSFLILEKKIDYSSNMPLI